MATKNTNIDVSKYGRQSSPRGKRVIRYSILIVCEGEKTEPNYFKEFAKNNQSFFVYDITVEGRGRGPKDVVKNAIELKVKNSYDRVWAVFDKDDILDNDFNEAINKATKEKIEVAWSNEAFELWYLYHFNNVVTGMSRKQYAAKISTAVKKASSKYKSENYKYMKNDTKNYEIMTTCGSMDQAMKYAEAQHNEYTDAKYAAHNPCTTVYRLVRQLLGKDKDFNNELTEKTEGLPTAKHPLKNKG